MKKIIVILVTFITLSSYSQTVNTMDSLLSVHSVKFPKIVLAQAILESGWFKCTNCSRELNNPFGFFWKGKYKSFRDLDHAVYYYKTWQTKWYKGGDYYSFLEKKGYAEDPNYINKLKQIVRKL